jgi:hypothetical protein
VGQGVVGARLVAAGVAAPPALPGVYRLRDAAGGLVYVGSSRNLARRVRSYFAPGHAPASKTGRIVRFTTDVEWVTCRSVVEALVLEARTIRETRPHFNRRLKQTGTHAYVRIDLRDPFPRLETTRVLEDGPLRYLGPFPGGRRLDRAVALLADALRLRTCTDTLRPDPGGRACLRLDLGQCGAPCIARVGRGEYGRQVARAIGALGGVDVETAQASGARAGPEPALLPPAVSGALRALRAARLTARALVVLPDAGEPGHRLLAIAGGRLVEAVSGAGAPGLVRAFGRALEALARPLPVLLPREVLDEVRIVTAWLASPAGRAAAIDAGRVGRAAAWSEVLARAAPGPLFSSGARPVPG